MGKNILKIDRIIEIQIYLYIVMMFLTRGEGVRNVLIFSSFILWLITLKERKNLALLRERPAKLFWVFVSVTFISVIFSIDPAYSLSEFKNTPLKAPLLFAVISTVMTDANKLKRFAYACLASALLIVCIGYYSYIVYDLPLLKPTTLLMNVYHNKFVKYLDTLLPFIFVLFFIGERTKTKYALGVFFIVSLVAIVLSTSRGGYAAFLSIALFWGFYLFKTNHMQFRKIILSVTVIMMIAGAITYFSVPHVRGRISELSGDSGTAHGRTIAWKASVDAFKDRPLTGWGYGKKIFHRDEPFQNTPTKKRPVFSEDITFDDPHNTFLAVLFHQGLIGFLAYVLLILFSIRYFWRESFRTAGISRYILAACVAVLIGNYLVHSMVGILRLKDLAVVLGIGMAAKGCDENSHS